MNQENKLKRKINLHAYYLRKLYCISKSKNETSWRITEFTWEKKVDIRHIFDN